MVHRHSNHPRGVLATLAARGREISIPESRHKYLYERLGDHAFQQLVGALLSGSFGGDFVPLPLRQADGGRDGLRRSVHGVYQVKWSVSGKEKDPVGWLDATVRGEASNLERLAAEGTKGYVIATNVPSTGVPGSGTFDRLNVKLEAYSEQYGLEITALWREGIDPLVDAASTEIKWAYADMLAGWDLVRYLVAEQIGAAQGNSTRNLVRRVAAAQWDRDRHIKFSEVELDRSQIAALFVDVEADRVQQPLLARQTMTLLPGESVARLGAVGGAASYLTSLAAYPFTLVRGAPGQGKSTLGQLVCQSYRVAFVPGTDNPEKYLPSVEQPRFPLRVDLGAYAAWRSGEDVFDESSTQGSKKLKKRRAAEATVEHYLAETMAHAGASPGLGADDVHELFARVPSLVVLDGLDEVGSAADRKQVVAEIDGFCSRGRTHPEGIRVVVTTRPNSSDLAEPDAGFFEALALAPLDKKLRGDYLRKWCAVHDIHGREGRALRTNFELKTREPHIGELASNPMQLTILLHLLRQFGDATPDQRTPLYDKYMEALLSREANKHPATVRIHQSELREMVPFLGWYLQSRSEQWAHSGRMTQAELIAAMKQFQSAYDRPLDVVDELFEATTDRLWALTSKEQGTFEFEVLSLREYFAAKYLYEAAGEEDRRFDRSLVLRELLRRPFWLNTARFYGGNASGSDLHSLRAGIEDELDEGPTRQFLVAAWSLICDGVFDRRPKTARALVAALVTADDGRFLVRALDAREVTALPDPEHGADAFDQLTTQISREPADRANPGRVRLLQDVIGRSDDFAAWWVEQMRRAAGTAQEEAWLAIGATCEVLAGKEVDLPGLNADRGHKAQLILNTGLVPEPESMLRRQLMAAVLDGQCSETTSARWEAGYLAVALSPEHLIPPLRAKAEHDESERSQVTRTRAARLLRQLGGYPNPTKIRRPTRRSEGTTLAYAETSKDLIATVGRCWLAVEIAVIGAASPLRDGFHRHPGDQPFGPAGAGGALIEETRRHRKNVSWWRDRSAECSDDLSLAEWALALWAVADGAVLDELLVDLDRILNDLSEDRYRSLLFSCGRLARANYLEGRHITATAKSQRTADLLATRQVATTDFDVPDGPLEPAPPAPLAAVARDAGWLKVDAVAAYR